MKKRLMAFLLAAVMLVGLLPLTALAETEAPEPRHFDDIDWDEHIDIDWDDWEDWLKALWNSRKHTHTYTVAYDSVGGSAVPSTEKKVEVGGYKHYDKLCRAGNETVTLAGAPATAPAGKEFAGWTLNGEVVTTVSVSRDSSVTVTAKWNTVEVPSAPTNPRSYAMDNLKVNYICNDHGTVSFGYRNFPHSGYIVEWEKGAETALVTVPGTTFDVLLKKYNETNPGHDFKTGYGADLSYEITWDGSKWTGLNPIGVLVECSTDAGDLDPAEKRASEYEYLNKTLWVNVQCEDCGPVVYKNLIHGGVSLTKFNEETNTVDVTVNTDAYLAAYNKDHPGHEVTSSNNTKFTITWDPETNTWSGAEAFVNIFVECETPATPVDPAEKRANEYEYLNKTLWVNVQCEDCGPVVYKNLIHGGVSLTKFNEETNTVDVTVNTDAYLAAYNKDHPGHEVTSSNNTKFTITWDPETNTWSGAEAFVNIFVECETPVAQADVTVSFAFEGEDGRYPINSEYNKTIEAPIGEFYTYEVTETFEGYVLNTEKTGAAKVLVKENGKNTIVVYFDKVDTAKVTVSFAFEGEDGRYPINSEYNKTIEAPIGEFYTYEVTETFEGYVLNTEKTGAAKVLVKENGKNTIVVYFDKVDTAKVTVSFAFEGEDGRYPINSEYNKTIEAPIGEFYTYEVTETFKGYVLNTEKTGAAKVLVKENGKNTIVVYFDKVDTAKVTVSFAFEGEDGRYPINSEYNKTIEAPIGEFYTYEVTETFKGYTLNTEKTGAAKVLVKENGRNTIVVYFDKAEPTNPMGYAIDTLNVSLICGIHESMSFGYNATPYHGVTVEWEKGSPIAFVTVTEEAFTRFLEKYNEANPGHTYAEGYGKGLTYEITWNGSEWTGLPNIGANVVCKTAAAPTNPMGYAIDTLNVSFFCKNHETMNFGYYATPYHGVTVDWKNGSDVAYVTITAAAFERFLENYNAAYPGHTFSDGYGVELVYEVKWDGSAWTGLPNVGVKVECEEPAVPVDPSEKRASEYKYLNETLVTVVNCQNEDHPYEKQSKVFNGLIYHGLNVSKFDPETNTVKVTVNVDTYLAAYNAEFPDHKLVKNGVQNGEFVLTWDPETNTWSGAEQFVNIYVECETPVEPETEYVTVTFKNGSWRYAKVTIEKGDSVGTEMPKNPERKGYWFAGWNTMKDGSGKKFHKTTEVNEDITVYAQWVKAEEGNPKTGDTIMMWVGILAVAAAGLAGAAYVTTKKKRG